MTTRHTVIFADARHMSMLGDASVNLVVTSPPYPMIEMWDPCFAQMNPDIEGALEKLDGRRAFMLMHAELDNAWRETVRVLANGGILCVNIGDATRKIGDSFRLYSNHARITHALFNLGMDTLPVILWRKQTNAPNKFMGSGMLPAGAYVTLEHEYILLFRKGGKREFSTDNEKLTRRRSAYFWEERNSWYSDIWDFKGVRQALAAGDSRNRSGAFPPELAYRLICMYSVYGDTVLDPFLGTGTTMLAAAALGRNSLGVESDRGLEKVIDETMRRSPAYSSESARGRLKNHLAFVDKQAAGKRELKHFNRLYGFPVVTTQETDLKLVEIKELNRPGGGDYTADYLQAELKGEQLTLKFDQ